MSKDHSYPPSPIITSSIFPLDYYSIAYYETAYGSFPQLRTEDTQSTLDVYIIEIYYTPQKCR